MLLLILVLVLVVAGLGYWVYRLRTQLTLTRAACEEAKQEALQAVKEAAALEGLDYELIRSLIEQEITPTVETVLAAHERGKQQTETLRRGRASTK